MHPAFPPDLADLVSLQRYAFLKAEVEVLSRLRRFREVELESSRFKPLVYFIEHALVCRMLCRAFSKAMA